MCEQKKLDLNKTSNNRVIRRQYKNNNLKTSKMRFNKIFYSLLSQYIQVCLEFFLFG